MPLIEVTEKNLDQTIKDNEFVLLDFWASWCRPCDDFKKVLEEVAPRYPEFIFASINIEKESKLAEDFHIRSIPSVMILRSQVILYADSGALTATALADLLDQAKVVHPAKRED